MTEQEIDVTDGDLRVGLNSTEASAIQSLALDALAAVTEERSAATRDIFAAVAQARRGTITVKAWDALHAAIGAEVARRRKPSDPQREPPTPGLDTSVQQFDQVAARVESLRQDASTGPRHGRGIELDDRAAVAVQGIVTAVIAGDLLSQGAEHHMEGHNREDAFPIYQDQWATVRALSQAAEQSTAGWLSVASWDALRAEITRREPQWHFEASSTLPAEFPYGHARMEWVGTLVDLEPSVAQQRALLSADQSVDHTLTPHKQRTVAASERELDQHRQRAFDSSVAHCQPGRDI